MTFDLYAAVRSLAVRIVRFLIVSWKRVLLWCFFLLFLYVIFIYNNHCLMIQMNPMNNNMTDLDLNLGQLVHLAQYWVGY